MSKTVKKLFDKVAFRGKGGRAPKDPNSEPVDYESTAAYEREQAKKLKGGGGTRGRGRAGTVLDQEGLLG